MSENVSKSQLKRMLRDVGIHNDFDREDMLVIHKLFHPVSSPRRNKNLVHVPSFISFFLEQVQDIFVPRSKGPIESVALSFDTRNVDT